MRKKPSSRVCRGSPEDLDDTEHAILVEWSMRKLKEKRIIDNIYYNLK
jgi:hypothetical protein